MLKKIAVFSFTILLAIPTLASRPSLSADEKKEVLLLGRDTKAIYELTVANPGDETDTFSINIENRFALRLSGILVNPEEPSVTLASGESQTIKIYANIVPEKVLPDTYQIMVVVQSAKTGQESYYPLSLGIRSPVPINLQVDKEESYKPTNVSFRIRMFNALPRDLKNLQVKVDIYQLTEETLPVKEVKAKETITKTLSFSFPSTTSPGKYLTTVTVSNGKKYATKKFWLRIEEYTPPVRIEKEEKFQADGYYTSFRLENPGNVKGIAKKEVAVNRVTGWLVKPITPPTEVIREEQIVYRWVVELEPGQVKRISYKFWYLPLYLIAAAVVLIAFGGYWYTLTPVITKQVVQESSIEKPTESRVILTIKNRTNKKIRNMRIKDLLPLVSENLKDYGTVEPKKTTKTNKGELLVWELKSLDPKEERVLSYKMKNVLGVIGGLRLPKAALYYKVNGKQKKKYSNITRLR